MKKDSLSPLVITVTTLIVIFDVMILKDDITTILLDDKALREEITNYTLTDNIILMNFAADVVKLVNSVGLFILYFVYKNKRVTLGLTIILLTTMILSIGINHWATIRTSNLFHAINQKHQ